MNVVSMDGWIVCLGRQGVPLSSASYKGMDVDVIKLAVFAFAAMLSKYYCNFVIWRPCSSVAASFPAPGLYASFRAT
jgi:hypothetical protein